MAIVSTTEGPAPAERDELDAAWLTKALGLGRVLEVGATPIGSGNSSLTLRLHLGWEDLSAAPATLIAKVAVTDPERRRTALAWRAYELEASFYVFIAAGLKARIPHCYWAGYDSDTGATTIILEDFGDLEPGDDVVGCEPAAAAAAMAELALVHAPRWADPALAEMPWLNRYPKGNAGALGPEMAGILPVFIERYAERLSAEVVDQVIRFTELAGRYDRKGINGPRTVAHGDPRSDNLLFGAERACLLDWQTVHLGSGPADVAYCLGALLATEDRRAHEADLVRSYHARLQAEGVDLPWDQCWTEYRRHAFSLLTTMLKVSTVDFHQRGRDMVVALVGRAAQQAIDLESEALLWR